jgi:hypothetical protein
MLSHHLRENVNERATAMEHLPWATAIVIRSYVAVEAAKVAEVVEAVVVAEAAVGRAFRNPLSQIQAMGTLRNPNLMTKHLSMTLYGLQT